MVLSEKYLKMNCLPLCMIYLGIVLLLAFFQQEYSVIPQLNQKMAESETDITSVIESFMRLRWFLIITPAVSILVRIAIISSCLYVGSFFFFIEDETNSFSRWWNITVKSQIIMIIYGVVVSLINILISSEAALAFPQKISLLVLFDSQIPERWMQIPLLAINIFEVLFWILMSHFIAIKNRITLKESLRFVLFSYVMPYFIYMCFLVFITIYVS